MSNRDESSKAGFADDATPWGAASAYARNRDDPAGAEARARQWAADNAEAIRAYNAFVEAHGVVGDDFRSW